MNRQKPAPARPFFHRAGEKDQQDLHDDEEDNPGPPEGVGTIPFEKRGNHKGRDKEQGLQNNGQTVPTKGPRPNSPILLAVITAEYFSLNNGEGKKQGGDIGYQLRCRQGKEEQY